MNALVLGSLISKFYIVILAICGVTNITWYALQEILVIMASALKVLFIPKALKLEYIATTSNCDNTLLCTVDEFLYCCGSARSFIYSEIITAIETVGNTYLISLLPVTGSDFLTLSRSITSKVRNCCDQSIVSNKTLLLNNLEYYREKPARLWELLLLPVLCFLCLATPLVALLYISGDSYSLAVLAVGVFRGLLAAYNKQLRVVFTNNLGTLKQFNKFRSVYYTLSFVVPVTLYVTNSLTVNTMLIVLVAYTLCCAITQQLLVKQHLKQ